MQHIADLRTMVVACFFFLGGLLISIQSQLKLKQLKNNLKANKKTREPQRLFLIASANLSL